MPSKHVIEQAYSTPKHCTAVDNWFRIDAVLYENIFNVFLTSFLDVKYDSTKEMKTEKQRHPPSIFFVVNGSFHYHKSRFLMRLLTKDGFCILLPQISQRNFL